MTRAVCAPLTLNVPIFDGFEKSAKVNEAKVDYLKASSDYQFMKRYFDLEYKDAVGKYNTSGNAVKRQRDNTALADNVYEQTLLQYRQGTATLSDLLGAENSLSNSELSLMNATLQLRNAELDLKKASGTLLSIENH